MANEAHKEPTMEEILASIRKIISDDDTSAPASAATASDAPAAVAVTEVDFDDSEAEDGFEDIMTTAVEDELEDVMFDTDDVFEAEDHFEVETETQRAASSDTLPEPPSFEEMLGTVKEAEAETEEFVELAAEPAPVLTPEPANEAAPEVHANSTEADMAASKAYEQTTLTDDNTADAAAGSLGKLISKMDFGADNTIEGLVREMLKPMIKDWLDSNLPAIVETKVEAEVQRIARMAR